MSDNQSADGGATIKVVARTAQEQLKDISPVARKILFDEFKEQSVPPGRTLENTEINGEYVDDYYSTLLTLVNDSIEYDAQHEPITSTTDAVRRLLRYPFISGIIGSSDSSERVYLTTAKELFDENIRTKKLLSGEEISISNIIAEMRNFGLERVISLFLDSGIRTSKQTYISPEYQIITGISSPRQLISALGCSKGAHTKCRKMWVPGITPKRFRVPVSKSEQLFNELSTLITISDRYSAPYVRSYVLDNDVDLVVDISVLYTKPIVYRGEWIPPSARAATENKKVTTLISTLQRMSEVTHIGFYGHTMLDLLFSIEGTPFAHIYRHVVLFGIDNEYETFIRNQEIISSANIIAKESNARVTADSAKLQILQNIMEAKFPAKIAKINTDMRTTRGHKSKSDAYLSLLTERDRNIVLSEYEKLKVLWGESAANACPHVAILKRFDSFRSTDSALSDIYGELQSYFVLGSDWITCKLCSFRIMCQHLRIQTEMTITDALFRDISRALTPYYDTALYATTGRAAESGLQLDKCCKICGEIIISATEIFGPDDAEDVRASDGNDLLGRMIYGEAMSALGCIVPAGNSRIMLNKPAIASMIQGLIRPDIAIIDDAFRKIKTDTEIVIEDKVRLQTAIFVYALLTNLVNNPANKLAMISVEENRTQTKDVAKMAYLNLKITKTKLISRIMSTIRTGQKIEDLIYNNFMSALKKVTQKTSLRIKESSPEAEITAFAKTDSYHALLQRFGGPFALTLPAETKKEKQQKIQSVYFNIYAKSPVLVNKSRQLPPTDGFDAFTTSRTPPNMKVYTGYISRAASALIDYHQQEIFHVPAYILITSSGLDDLYTPTIVDKFEYNPILTAFYNDENHKLLHTGEAILEWRRHWYYTPNIGSWIPRSLVMSGAKIDTRMFEHIRVPLAVTFGADGHRHTWDVYLAGGSNGIVEIPKKKLTAEYLGPDGRSLQFITRKCSGCGLRHDEAINGIAGVGDVDILAGIAAAVEQDAALSFYETRCPIVLPGADSNIAKAGGELVSINHIFDNAGICTKCGRFDGDKHRRTDETDRKYYLQYRTRYEEEKRALSSSSNIVPRVSADTHENTIAYESNYNYVINMSKELKINLNILGTLGFQERVDYDIVKSGELLGTIENNEIKHLDNRVYKLEALARLFVIKFNQVIYARIAPVGRDIVALFTQFKIDPIVIYEERDRLSAITASFAIAMEQWRYSLSTKEFAGAILQELCRIAMLIYEEGGGKNTKLSDFLRGFIRDFFAKIIRTGELEAEYKRTFSWKIFNEDINLSVEIGESDLDDRNDVFEDIVADELAQQDELYEGSEPAPFEETYQMDNDTEENTPQSELE